VLGDSFVITEDLMRLFESKKLKSGLWKSDIYVWDKKNVDAAMVFPVSSPRMLV